MHILSGHLVRVLGLLSFLCSSFAFGQNYYVLEAQAALSSVKIDTPTAFGMGVALEDGATIATCAHVVENNNWVDVDAGEFKEQGYVIAVDTENDIAIVRLERKITPFYAYRSTDLPELGMFTMAAGKKRNSLDLDMRPGCIMLKLAGAFPNMIVSSEPKHGYSGGPILDKDGLLVGIMKAACTLDGDAATEVIPAWKLLEFIKETRKNMRK